MISGDKTYIKKAIELGRASMSSNNGGPFGAVVVKNGEIIGEGQNSVTALNDPTAHAEISAIRNACSNQGSYSLEGATLYTSCEPCPMCLGAIFWSRISKIVFAATREDATQIAGFDDDHFYEEINTTWEKRQIDYMEIGRKEGQALFREWQLKSDKRMY